jgi:hypothetical protein
MLFDDNLYRTKGGQRKDEFWKLESDSDIYFYFLLGNNIARVCEWLGSIF